MNLFTPPKKAVGTLKGVNANANVLIARFKELARDDGWSRQEAQQVADFARSKDYNGLIEVLNEHLLWY